MTPHRSQWILAAWLMILGPSAIAQSHPPTAIADDTSPPTSTSKGETVLYIRSSGLIADSTFIAASLNGGGSAMSEQLALLILQARDHSTQITVAGGSEPKTLRVIKDAFDSAGAVDLHLS